MGYAGKAKSAVYTASGLVKAAPGRVTSVTIASDGLGLGYVALSDEIVYTGGKIKCTYEVNYAINHVSPNIDFNTGIYLTIAGVGITQVCLTVE